MDERLQLVARRLAGEAMAELCREFGISRKTGYKIFDRYQECGVHGLTDRSRPVVPPENLEISGRMRLIFPHNFRRCLFFSGHSLQL